MSKYKHDAQRANTVLRFYENEIKRIEYVPKLYPWLVHDGNTHYTLTPNEITVVIQRFRWIIVFSGKPEYIASRHGGFKSYLSL